MFSMECDEIVDKIFGKVLFRSARSSTSSTCISKTDTAEQECQENMLYTQYVVLFSFQIHSLRIELYDFWHYHALNESNHQCFLHEVV